MNAVTRVVSALLLSCCACAMQAAETTYPVRPIRFIAPFAPGGPSDTLARLLSPRLNERLGQPVIVDNRPAAAGIVGFEMAAKSAPDGYTMLLGSNGGLTMNPSLYQKLPYNPARDYQAVTQIESGPQILVVHPSVPAKSVQELIALAKAKPGQINFASAGTTNRIAAELFKAQAGIDIVNVPYKGTGQALAELVGGQVQMMMMSALTAIAPVKSGKLRGLAVSSLKRAAVVADLPTVSESGLPGFESTSWHGVLVPSHTPRPIVARLHAESVKALTQPDVRERLATLGFEVVASTPEEFVAFIRQQTAKHEKLIKEIGLKAE
jgi:tripartite-type tricarboxylate transporter receptor subunit TctC